MPVRTPKSDEELLPMCQEGSAVGLEIQVRGSPRLLEAPSRKPKTPQGHLLGFAAESRSNSRSNTVELSSCQVYGELTASKGITSQPCRSFAWKSVFGFTFRMTVKPRTLRYLPLRHFWRPQGLRSQTLCWRPGRADSKGGFRRHDALTVTSGSNHKLLNI